MAEAAAARASAVAEAAATADEKVHNSRTYILTSLVLLVLVYVEYYDTVIGCTAGKGQRNPRKGQAKTDLISTSFFFNVFFLAHSPPTFFLNLRQLLILLQPFPVPAHVKVKSLEREFSAQSAQQQQQVEKAHASELETQRQQLLKDQHELKERFEKEVKDLKAQASVGVAQAVANQEAAAEAAAKLEARLRAELAAAQEATEKVHYPYVLRSRVCVHI